MRSHLARQKHLRLVLTPSEPQVVLVPKDLSPQGPGFPANAAASDLLPQSQPSWTALICQQPWELGEVGANKPQSLVWPTVPERHQQISKLGCAAGDTP